MIFYPTVQSYDILATVQSYDILATVQSYDYRTMPIMLPAVSINLGRLKLPERNG